MALGALRKLFPGIGIEGEDPDKVKPDPDKKIDPKPDDPAKDPAKSPGSDDPLAAFADIFDNKKPKDPKDEDTPLSVAGILNEETLKKLTDSIDFNTFLTDETRKALNDPENDGSAVFKAFNEIAGGSYRTAIQHAGKMSETILDDRLARLEAGLGEKINAHTIKSSISANELINKSPVLQAGISMIADRLQKSQPDADPKWITDQATKFFVESAKVLSGNEGDSKPGTGSPDLTPGSGEDTDWVGFAMGDTVNNPTGEGQSDSGDTGDK